MLLFGKIIGLWCQINYTACRDSMATSCCN